MWSFEVSALYEAHTAVAPMIVFVRVLNTPTPLNQDHPGIMWDLSAAADFLNQRPQVVVRYLV